MNDKYTGILRQIIGDFHASEIPSPSLRELDFGIAPKGVRKAVTLIGMRRSGKTWAVYQRMRALISSGLDPHKILYLNFEDDRLRPFEAGDCQSILDAYFSLYPNLADNSDLHFFFDEIQEIHGWETFIRRLLDQEKMSLVLTGSSSRMFSREIATALRGRTITYEIFPFSFREYLIHKGVSLDVAPTSKQIATLRHHRETYQTFGGFPEAVIMGPQHHRELLQGYIETVIYRDLIERHHISNTTVTREFVSYCLQNSAAPLSVNRIYQRFKSLGRVTSKDLFYGLMEHLEDAYCLYSVPVFSHSASDRARNPKKIYGADPGLITAYSVKPAFDRSARLETMVFNELRRRTRDIYYVSTSSGYEVDFLTLNPNGRRELLQVTASLADPDTEKREVRALVDAMGEMKIHRATILTEDDDERRLTISGKKIDILPTWKWLLGAWMR